MLSSSWWSQLKGKREGDRRHRETSLIIVHSFCHVNFYARFSHSNKNCAAGEVKLSSFTNWQRDSDYKNEWISCECNDINRTMVKTISFSLCHKYFDKIRTKQNYSDEFVSGVRESSLKKTIFELLFKNCLSEIHKSALELEINPSKSISLFTSTTICK